MRAVPAVAATLPVQVRPSDFSLSDVRVFFRIPEHHHDVVALRGMVLVYETDALNREGIVDGALYVVENQRPFSGMSWETYDGLNHDHRRSAPRAIIQTSRRVVRVVRCERDPDQWWHVLPSGFRDGPISDWCIAHNFVGKVVGAYQPVPLTERTVP